jgi:polygalacturonase
MFRCCLLAACCVATHLAEIVVTPEEFGAVGDGKANDWVPIQQALAACSAVVYNATAPQQPCRVLFSKSYLSGPLIINSSRTTLDVATGATLGMLPRADYEIACPQKSCTFISTGPNPDEPGKEGCRTVYPNPHAPTNGYTVCLSDVTLTGGGTIDGGSTWDPNSWWLCGRLNLPCWRPKMSYFGYIERFTFSGSLTFSKPPTGSLRSYGNIGTRISGLTINAPYSTRNTDGINVYGGYDTLIENGVIDNGDDCISFVPTGEWIPGKVSNVTGDFCFEDPGNALCSGGHAIVRNITCNGGHGLSIGGIRHGTVTNVTFSNITATGGQPGCTQDEAAGGGCRVKSRPNSTGTVSEIRYEDMVFKDVYWPLQLLGHCKTHPHSPPTHPRPTHSAVLCFSADCPFPCKQADGKTSTLFTNISFERVRGSTSQRSIIPGTETTVAQFKCTNYTPCTNVTMRDVVLTDKAGHAGKLDCENAVNVVIDNSSSPDACA